MSEPFGAHPELFLRLPPEILVDVFARLGVRDLGHLAATCRLLQYSLGSSQTPNPVEVALLLRVGVRGWSRTLPLDPHRAVRYLLRLARQADLEFHAFAACCHRPISFFVGADGSMCACGVELQSVGSETFLDLGYAAHPGSLGFDHVSEMEPGSHSHHFKVAEPTLVPATAGVRMRSMATGASHCLALTEQGQVYRWGDSETVCPPRVPTLFKELGELNVVSVAAGAWHSAALTDEGKLYTWWDQTAALDYQMNSATGSGYKSPPFHRETLDFEYALCRPRFVKGLAGMRIISVAAGFQFTVVATDQGRVFSFGKGRGHCLGHGSTEPQVLPKEIEALRNVDVATVSAGHTHVLALTYTGGVYSWGSENFPPALGHGNLVGQSIVRTPTHIEALRGVRCVAAGEALSCAVTEAGHVYTWGRGASGALGHDDVEDQPLPKRVEKLRDVVAVGVTTGRNHTLVAGADGAVWGFGCLNAIGIWNDPTLKAMVDAAGDSSVRGEDSFQVLFADELDVEDDEVTDSFHFVLPGGRSSISFPMRIPVDVQVRGH